MVERVQVAGETAESINEDVKHVERMIGVAETGDVNYQPAGDKGDANEASSDSPQLPDGGFDKFLNKETGEYDWQAHAKDAEYRLEQSRRDRSKAQGEADASQSETGEGEGEANAQQQQQQSEQTTTVDLDALAQEFQENGELSKDSYENLAKHGISQEFVDRFIEGQVAIAEQRRNEIQSLAGGEDQYKAMTDWARENWSREEILAYNKAVDGGDVAQAKLAVNALRAQYESEVGVEPHLISPSTYQAAGTAFASWAQVTEAMSDPRYHNDPAYRAEIEAKLSRSGDLR